MMVLMRTAGLLLFDASGSAHKATMFLRKSLSTDNTLLNSFRQLATPLYGLYWRIYICQCTIDSRFDFFMMMHLKCAILHAAAK